MITLQENLLNLIREKCSPLWRIDIYKDHIITNLPEIEDDFRQVYNKAKKEIIACIELYVPERHSEMHFEVRIGSWNCSFKIGKTI